MAQKKITDLGLIESLSDELNLVGDNGTQTYRLTIAQIKAFILATQSVTRDKIVETERNPIGTILPFGGTSAPSGYLLCNGAAVSRTTYAALYAVVGNAFGHGDGSTTFNLPDARGRFMRFADNGVSPARDPDRATRTTMATGGNTGDNVGSIQDDAYENHDHADTLAAPDHYHFEFKSTYNTGSAADVSSSNYPYRGASNAGGADAYRVNGQASAPDVGRSGGASATALTGSVSTSTTGSTESRPKNFNVNAIIKF